MAIKGNLGVNDWKDGKCVSEVHVRKSGGKNFVITEASTRQSSILDNTTVETLRAVNVNGYEVTVERYNGDDNHLQVFIDKGSRTIHKSISMAELDKFIAGNTR